ncbi:hypothetical protein A2716_01465 [candidate division WWE3 bacterium RIFCSPHIGHO2_01_FULL_40_23]|uniref:CBM-cenC domain-containing protein n=1 Tax=candidate division WWE3 bacterium RIFCSPLOWO2_01_FULL_41_18 TaxID=1802625 RepID=A0A1F4VEJ9_UNCKA|nr:MAG: hypothetical protein A2716_01465 [candidate division WWE3 bacterium RIFCSPHIGHO2_01_FULL_40_23]OGC55398.1 MAG: hypothetical protein A3A78_00370 [candidate division WWE3 bacterium RIFCSPLOWO2_01_FULL_41_18]
MKKSLALFFIFLLLLEINMIFKSKRYSRADSDTTPPTSTLSQIPSSPDGTNDWYVSPIDFTITADDLESGVRSISYKLDSDDVQTQIFNNTLNLVQNPSFEEAGTPVNLWDKTNDDINAVFTQDSIAAPSFGTKSAKISATTGTWNGYNNRNNFAVATSNENMTSSLWIKTQNVNLQVNYKIYAVYTGMGGSEQTQLIAATSDISGTNDWQKLTLNFVVNVDNAIGVYMDMGIKGSGSAWFDGASITSAFTQPSVEFVVSSNGSHTLEYYSTDNAGNEETHQTTTFKIDTKAPSRFTNFTITQAGNDHTFIVSISVTDNTSGLDTGTAQFQYSVDEGVTWGYYSDFSNCNSTFTEDWTNGSTNPSTSGTKNTIISTPAIDFCNNNWAVTKKIRFKIKDLAGNQGQSADFTINGAWIEVVNGDIFANEGISMQSSSKITYLAGAVDGISNITSTNNWFLEDYEAMDFSTYDEWYAKNPTTTALPAGKLPTTSGSYRVNSDFTIASTTVPNGLDDVQDLSGLIYVNGDLNINSNYELHDTSGIIFIVKGDITVNSAVSSIDGFFITDALFDLTGGNTQIDIFGGVQADEYNMKRSLSGNQNSTTPAQIFTYKPKYLIVGKNQLTTNSDVTWLEVK